MGRCNSQDEVSCPSLLHLQFADVSCRDKQWDAILKIHVTAPFKIIRAAAPYMRDAAKAEIQATGEAQPRSIVNISSTSGLHGNFGQINYATAKMGILGMTKTIAKEWVRVFCCLPDGPNSRVLIRHRGRSIFAAILLPLA